MWTVQPGEPRRRPQALSTGCWKDIRLVAFVSGSSLVIFNGTGEILQTIYHDANCLLDAVALDEATGAIAVSAGRRVQIYSPIDDNTEQPKWSKRCLLNETQTAEKERDRPSLSLSWGIPGELLVGGSVLQLWSISEGGRLLWSRALANNVKCALFSPDAGLIVSISTYDRLVKVWRRQSFDPTDTRFDYTYLSHPSAVTAIQWQCSSRQEHKVNVLYTICTDNKLRIWHGTDTYGLQFLQLSAEIDLLECIQPRLASHQFDTRPTQRYAFIINSQDFAWAIERAKNEPSANAESLEHLVEIAARSPDIVVVLDKYGNLSAWAVEDSGYKTHVKTKVFNVAHVHGLDWGFRDVSSDDSYAQFEYFCDPQHNKSFTFLVHHFDGRIEWLEAQVDEFFDALPRQKRLTPRLAWSGHSGAIKKVVRTAAGNAVVSRTDDNEVIVWKQISTRFGTNISRQSKINMPEHIHRTCLLNDGQFLVFLHHTSISVYDARSATASKAASVEYTVSGKPLCLIALPGTEASRETAYVATITSTMKGIAWEVNLPGHGENRRSLSNGTKPTLQEFFRFDLGMKDDLAFVLPVDPAGSDYLISGFLDTFARDVAISYTKSGVLRSWTAKVDTHLREVQWLLTSAVETGISEPSLASATSIRKTALVDSDGFRLTIWDMRGAQLEYEKKFEAPDYVQDLDWTSTPDGQSILAVGFPHKVHLLSQLRFDYFGAQAAWTTVREIDISRVTSHPIGDSTWLGGGNLVIGSGNQLLVCDKKLEISASKISGLGVSRKQRLSREIFDIVAYLNGPLPVFHPQFLSQCILCGKSALVRKILLELNEALKYFTAGDELDSLLGVSLSNHLENNKGPTKARKDLSYEELSSTDDSETFTDEMAASLNERLTTVEIPQLSNWEQFHLADIVECVATAEKHRRSMDDNATRFLLFFRQHFLRRGRAALNEYSLNDSTISWREITWAFHSGSQDILVDLVSRHFLGKMLWEQARDSGVFMWMTDLQALRAQFEIIARNEYTKTDEKNPIDCSLYYIALRKKNVLVGLWRMASWNKEQAATQKLLSNNFQDSRWRTAALKNAFALLGKRRFQYAAAFFLLAGNLKDAALVCINQLKDIQLAIAIVRVYEGDNGPVLHEILTHTALPLAAKEGDRWLATWAFWMLKRRDLAVRALISPVYTLLETQQSPNLHAKSFLVDDPALIVLYRQLRSKTLQTLHGASKNLPTDEWNFVIHTARLYDRMGCDLLALDLAVRNWEFLPPPKAGIHPLDQISTLPKFQRRTSLILSDLPTSSWSETAPPPVGVKHSAGFQEPSTSSLLDNFGF
ncbi:WD repeat protein-like protein [Xylona heveae TC161]|uniref:WD repeat protein-like protein n=1 Tax=Xylona heveae (strain CBS 132557 / TC161) TaxID=1328760 RepID=A0A165IQ34_XYLHT|nr:WD repeat protein-like protein [Xylona heveae TC161]KZF25219.1 WD repeat protein-like protein [Xylona heveae TC161]